MKHPYIQQQSGLAMMVLVFMIAMVFTGFSLTQYNADDFKQAQSVKTQQSLAIAKNALLAYSLEKLLDPDSPLTSCSDNCPRPGDMPCPDTDNDGESDCSSILFGRLPWKTLGIDDIRDGANERLWYGVSSKYKNSSRVLPLNSDTKGTISLKNTTGVLLHVANTNTGLAAVVIAPGSPITRQDDLVQSRSAANELNPKHYLDVALGEDNSDFEDGSTGNGFISGSIKESNNLIVNDVVATITSAELNKVMQNRVLIEVKKILDIDATYPNAADPSDTTCLSLNSKIEDTDCISTATIGLIPVSDGSNSVWSGAGILTGVHSDNWFQQNGWRTLVEYNPAECVANTADCLSF